MSLQQTILPVGPVASQRRAAGDEGVTRAKPVAEMLLLL